MFAREAVGRLDVQDRATASPALIFVTAWPGKIGLGLSLLSDGDCEIAMPLDVCRAVVKRMQHLDAGAAPTDLRYLDEVEEDEALVSMQADDAGRSLTLSHKGGGFCRVVFDPGGWSQVITLLDRASTSAASGDGTQERG
jgi:hypothetical protein